jgi:hypothetical protein
MPQIGNEVANGHTMRLAEDAMIPSRNTQSRYW